jgi:dienelactone hydrolase
MASRFLWLPFVLIALQLPAQSAEPPKPYAGPWDVQALQTAVVKPEWGNAVGAGKASEIYYPGEPFKGKATRVFAYYAKPEGAGPFPAVLCVHGGGGKAFDKWAKHWAARGYCALAMDLAGAGPQGKLSDGGPGQDDDAKFRDFTDADVKDMWTYHAVAAVLRGHTLLASLPEVDKDRVAVTGISWGGYLTCIIAGLDDRLKAAVPVYGCGYLHENSAWKGTLDAFASERRNRWVKNFDPSRYLPGVKCPILFLNGTNDFAHPMDSYQKCYDLVKKDRWISVRIRLPHGHIWTFGEVDAFIDSYLKKGDKLPIVSAMTKEGDTVSASIDSKVKLKSASLHYAVAEGPWPKREWKTIPAVLLKNGTMSAKLPAVRPLVYELAVTDERNLEITTPHVIQK